MNGIHDMGGMHGFGPVDVSDDAKFHEDWEPRARAMAHISYESGYFNLDAFRSTIEELDPADYLASSYFERWLKGVEIELIARGYLTQEELDSRLAEIEAGTFETAESAPPPPMKPSVTPPDLPVTQRFEVGDAVRVRNNNPNHHSRAPRYLRGKAGVIQTCRGHEVFPDTNARYLGDRPQVVYNVTFEGQELWGDSAELGQLLSIDLWDSYLEPA